MICGTFTDEQYRIYNYVIESRLEKIFYDPDFEITENNKTDQILILNFNYTNTIELYIKAIRCELPISTICIHGNLKHPNDPIIFGYGDEMDQYYEKLENLNNDEFLRNIKSFWYFKTNNYQRFLRFIESEEYKVYILGHSCGISDRILLNNIFEDKHCRAIKIYYHQRGENDTDYFEKTQEISRHFKPENKSLMRKLIVPFPECSPLS